MQKYQDLNEHEKQQVFQRINLDLETYCAGEPLRLERFGYRVYSQSDEDGIIAEIFRRIGTTNRTFVEFGAEVGLENNSRLLLEQGWNGLWIEGNPDYAGSIRWTYREEIERQQLKFISSFVYAENINQLISSAGIRGEVDMLSIDIDSNDWFVWKAIDVINARVIVLEHNHSYPPPTEYVMPYNPDYYWDGTGAAIYGSSLTSNWKLGLEKGYTMVGTGLYSANAFFVRNDLVSDKFPGLHTPENYWKKLDYKMVLKYPIKLASEV